MGLNKSKTIIVGLEEYDELRRNKIIIENEQ